MGATWGESTADGDFDGLDDIWQHMDHLGWCRSLLLVHLLWERL